MTETSATPLQPTQEELLKVKDLQDKAVSDKLHTRFQSNWREFKRNFDRGMQSIKKGMSTVGNTLQAKLEAANTWYLGNFLYTIWGGAFVGSLITCASILAQHLMAATAITAAMPVVGAAVFAIPIIVFAVYWAIRWIIQSITGMINMVKNGLSIAKLATELKKTHPETDLLKVATDTLKDKLAPAPSSAY